MGNHNSRNHPKNRKRKGSHPKNLKLIFLGDGGVGNSAIIIQYTSRHFFRRYDPTIEETYYKEIEFETNKIKLEILDTAGTEQFQAMRLLYFKMGQLFIVTFSLLSEGTLFGAEKIIAFLIQTRADEEKVPILLIGNKLDLIDKREIPRDKAEFIASKWDLPYIEVTAKDYDSVEPAFDLIIHHYFHCLGIDSLSYQTILASKYFPKSRQRSEEELCQILNSGESIQCGREELDKIIKLIEGNKIQIFSIEKSPIYPSQCEKLLNSFRNSSSCIKWSFISCGVNDIFLDKFLICASRHKFIRSLVIKDCARNSNSMITSWREFSKSFEASKLCELEIVEIPRWVGTSTSDLPSLLSVRNDLLEAFANFASGLRKNNCESLRLWFCPRELLTTVTNCFLDNSQQLKWDNWNLSTLDISGQTNQPLVMRRNRIWKKCQPILVGRIDRSSLLLSLPKEILAILIFWIDKSIRGDDVETKKKMETDFIPD